MSEGQVDANMQTEGTTTEAGSNLGRVARIYSMWGRHAWLYAAQDWLTFMGRHRRIRRAAARALGVSNGDRVLEVGCGTGRNFRFVMEEIGSDGELVGFDYSPEMLSAAERLFRRKGWHNVRLIEGDSAELNVSPGAFDGVLCVLALSAIPDHVRTLGRCRRVLRVGGVLAVCDARPFPGAMRFLNPLARRLYVGTTNWHPDRDVIGAVRNEFGTVQVREFNAGSFFVARSVKEAGNGTH